jgi:hypothetical protein
MYKIDSDRPAISLLLIEHLARYVLSKRQMTNHNFKTCINTVDTVLFFYLCKDTKDLESTLHHYEFHKRFLLKELLICRKISVFKINFPFFAVIGKHN